MNDLNEFMATEVMGWRNAGDWFLDGDDYWMGDGTSSIFTGMKCKDWHPDTDLNQAMMCADKFYNISGNRVIIHILKYEDMPLAICSAIQQAVENGK